MKKEIKVWIKYWHSDDVEAYYITDPPETHRKILLWLQSQIGKEIRVLLYSVN